LNGNCNSLSFAGILKNIVMKKLIVVLIAFILGATSVFAQKIGKGEAPKPTEFYACPKHNKITSHEPGKCSVCGTELSLSAKEKRAGNDVKRYSCPVHADVASHDPGKCPKCGKRLTLSNKELMKAEVTKIYTCPMHPEVALTKDGICPNCGKDLIEKKGK
jgi:transcription initiation factor IIE alpha subunit